ncbi:AAA family ATPase [Alteribacillus sp. HJP-4]|uniref:AAA family ATPase n=1 Tax=Alteribacillus sp. HJP-4 TaxID=2775394 RepID=UPI0035CCE434
MAESRTAHKYQLTISPAAESRKYQIAQPMQTAENHYPLRKAEKTLDCMVGMDDVRRFIKEMYSFVYVNEQRVKHGLKPTKQNLHMLFAGNPGTGKTTIARLIAEMLKEMNVLTKGHLIEAERADLVGEYIGQTAQKTRALVQKASGGVLFIDEAYSLARGGEKDFGREAVDTLVKAMEDKQHHFILILAGYPDEMQRLLNLNPGLSSRFPNQLYFEDFNAAQLFEIFEKMVQEKEFWVNALLKDRIRKHFFELVLNKRNDHNGRYVRNLLEKIIRRHAVRILEQPETADRDALMTLTEEDFIMEKHNEKKKYYTY